MRFHLYITVAVVDHYFLHHIARWRQYDSSSRIPNSIAKVGKTSGSSDVTESVVYMRLSDCDVRIWRPCNKSTKLRSTKPLPADAHQLSGTHPISIGWLCLELCTSESKREDNCFGHIQQWRCFFVWKRQKLNMSVSFLCFALDNLAYFQASVQILEVWKSIMSHTRSTVISPRGNECFVSTPGSEFCNSFELQFFGIPPGKPECVQG